MHQRKRTKKRATKRATKRSTKGPTKHPSSKQFTKKNMKSFSQITHKLPTEKIYTYPDPVLDFFDQFNYDEFILQHNNVNIDVTKSTHNKVYHFQINENFYKMIHILDSHKKPVLLGSGSYGKIYLVEIQNLSNTSPPFRLALKLDSDAREFHISNELYRKCNTLQTKFFMKSKDKFFYFMQLADGNLKDYKDKILMHQSTLKTQKDIHLTIIHICENIRKQLLCLLKYNKLYSDLKMENCLYKYITHQNKIETIFMLGDLGSAYINTDGDHIGSFPPHEYLHGPKPGFFRVNKKKYSKVLSWEIGILLYQLSPKTNDDKICKLSSDYFLNWQKPCSKQYNNYLKKARKSLDKWYGKGIGNYLHKNPNQRPNINHKILDIIS